MVNWGIIGTGNIAKTFASELAFVQNANLFGVGSRRLDTAQIFTQKYTSAHPFGSYDELLQSSEIDAIYIATPHSSHAEIIERAIRFRKPVLCEKPFSINYSEAQKALQLAQAAKLLVIEGMWTYFQPLFQQCIEIIKSGELGSILSLEVDTSFIGSNYPQSRLYNPCLGGGSLLDVGIYNIALLTTLLGEPDSITANATLTGTGIDTTTILECKFASGQRAHLTSSIEKKGTRKAIINCQNGSIHIPDPWWHVLQLDIHRDFSPIESITMNRQGYGFAPMIEEFHACLKRENIESSIMPWRKTLLHMKIMDQVRAQLGIVYPTQTN